MTEPSAEARLIRALVERLRMWAAAPGVDHEKCHAEEDSIYLNTLKGIALGLIDDPRACAAEAIKAADIKFRRHCAQNERVPICGQFDMPFPGALGPCIKPPGHDGDHSEGDEEWGDRA